MTENPQPNPKNHKQETKAKEERARARRERWMVIFTGVISFIGAVQAATSYLQWDAMRKALDVNERAWVIPSPPTEIVLEPNVPMKLGASLKNYGKGPAFDVVLSWRRVFTIHPPPAEPKRQPGENRSPMMAGDVHPVLITMSALNTSDTTDINAGTKQLFVIGDVIYSDPFTSGSDRFTRTCFLYLPKTHNWTYCDLQTYR